MLQWLLLNFPKNCPKGSNGPRCCRWIPRSSAMARREHIGGVYDRRNGKAAESHLNVVKWLHANRSEGCTATAMDEAASMGRLDVVQWLHENRNEGCTTQAMDNAARNGHLAMVQWLHANRSEGCTANAMNNAVKLGHPIVATWLNTHFPQHGLTAADVTVATFEMLLYLHTNFAHLFTSQFVKDLRRKFRSAYNQGHVVAWLNENFPSS